MLAYSRTLKLYISFYYCFYVYHSMMKKHVFLEGIVAFMIYYNYFFKLLLIDRNNIKRLSV